MKYSKTNYLNLLKYSNKLEKEGRYIYDESEKDFFKLLEYSIMMINHLHWKNRTQYLELIKQFLNGPINFLDLREKYKAVNDVVKSLETELILFELDEKSERFSNWIDDIISLFDEYYVKVDDKNELSDEDVKK